MMKLFLTAFLLGLAPNVLTWNLAAAEGASCCEDPHQIVVLKGDGEGAPCKFVTVTAEPVEGDENTINARVVFVGEDGEPVVGQVANGSWVSRDGEKEVVIVTQVGDEKDGDVQADGAAKSARTIKVIARGADDENAAERGWLGVSIGGVPEALAAQLALQGRGILVLNVVDGSPADMAGIEAHDILLSVKGQDISSEVGLAVDAIKALKPGETAGVVVLRNGQQKTMNVTLGSRADLKEKKIEWKFEGMPDAEVEEHVKTRGKFMMRDPSGNWITKDLGDLDKLQNLPHNIRMFVPEAGSRSTQVFVENGKKTIKMHVENDGTTFSIEQVDDGSITVRRTDADGNETVATYENAEALKAADEEAYQLYDGAGAAVTIQMDGEDGAHSIFLHQLGEDDLSDVGDAEWQQKLEESLAETREAHRRLMEELHETLGQMHGGGAPNDAQLKQLHELLQGQGGSLPHAFAVQAGKPKHTFESQADGSIEVRIRKGDSELVQKFNNESDLSKRNPELYKKYQSLKSADKE